jgi:hypothetical protein
VEAVRHISEARRLLTEIRDDTHSDLVLARADLAPIVQGPPLGATPPKKH